MFEITPNPFTSPGAQFDIVEDMAHSVLASIATEDPDKAEKYLLNSLGILKRGLGPDALQTKVIARALELYRQKPPTLIEEV